jgi:hypothetical protein
VLQVYGSVPGIEGGALFKVYAKTMRLLALVGGLLLSRLGLLSSPAYLYSALFMGRKPVRAVKRNVHLLAAVGAAAAVLALRALAWLLRFALISVRSALAA